MRLRRKKHLGERLETTNDYVLFIENKHRYGRPVKEDYIEIDTLKIFGRTAPVYLEIGCGKGGFITELALLHPENDYLAVEKDENVMVSGAETALQEKIPNLRFIAVKAENLPFMLKEKSISGIYLNFSCPYPKGTYKNRRLTNPRFLNIYKDLLVEKGFIIQKTDNRPFFDYSVESFSESNYFISELTYDLYNSEYLNGNIPTEYEKKFVSLGKPICRLKAFYKGE